MKRRDEYFSKELMPVVLTAEDLRELESVLKDHCEAVTICTPEYTYDSMDELIGHQTKTVRLELKIRTERPAITIRFNKYKAEVEFYGQSTEHTGLSYKSIEFLKKKRRVFWFAYSYPFLVIGPPAISVLLYLFLKDSQYRLLDNIPFVWSIWAFFIRLTRHSQVTTTSTGIKGFWERKKDDLIVNLFVLGAGFVLGWLAGQLK